MAGLSSDAQRAIEEAIELFERKGNSVGASQAADLLKLEVPADERRPASQASFRP